MTSDQEAVCGTCAPQGLGCTEADHRIITERDGWGASRDHIGEPYCRRCYAANRSGDLHPFIPAPVVPSDDEPPVLCVKVQGTGATWVCNRPPYDVVHQHVNNARPGSGKHDFKPPAPPTPSQDAEGDRLTEAWWDYDRYRAGDRYPVERAKRRAAVESAIRAPYEELVKALLRHEYVQSWLVNFKTRGVDGLKDAMEREYDDPDSMVAAFGDAITRIEESQKHD